jgi:hypothetical protein
VKDWLAYGGAFALALGAAMLCSWAGFTLVLSGYGYDIGGFILLVFLAPLLTGFVTFGVSYAAFSKQRFGSEGWLNGFALVFVAGGGCIGLVVARVLEEPFAALLLVVILFIGGRLMINRRTDA